jgi:hypothetical protein
LNAQQNNEIEFSEEFLKSTDEEKQQIRQIIMLMLEPDEMKRGDIFKVLNSKWLEKVSDTRVKQMMRMEKVNEKERIILKELNFKHLAKKVQLFFRKHLSDQYAFGQCIFMGDLSVIQ